MPPIELLERAYITNSELSGILLPIADGEEFIATFHDNSRIKAESLDVAIFYRQNRRPYRLLPNMPSRYLQEQNDWYILEPGQEITLSPHDEYGVGNFGEDKPSRSWRVPQKSH